MPAESSPDREHPTRVDGPEATEPSTRRGGEARVERIGRFVVLRKLGEGGMGVVYAAYDEELERKVAIKVLRGELRGARQSVGQARLLREARSMARLSHPNVAQIHEVGQHGSSAVFIAMEFVSGGNLSEWLRREERAWREIRAVFVQAGRGLAAAHAVGIVHRDFKPDNVLVGEDGRVRVVDFGLARHDEVTASTESEVSSGASSELTQAGTFIGTPAYMAPEQLRREPADALSDQFSFCVALFEGLYGFRPFKGSTTAEISRSVLSEERLDPPRDSEVPGRILQVLARGLQLDPAARFPSMEALLAVLEADPEVVRRRRLTLAGLALGTILAAGGGGYAVYELQAEGAARCASARERLAGAWDPELAARVRAALTGTGVGYAVEVAERVEASLSGYADAWVEMSQETCESRRRGEQSDALYDLRMACLGERREALGALAGALAEADLAALEKAAQAAEKLPSLARCADARALLTQHPPPEDPALARAVDELQGRVARGRARFELGQYQALRAELTALRAEAEVTGYAPLIAGVLHLEGGAQDALGDYAAAEASLLGAVAAADRGAADDARAFALVDLARVVGLHQARFDEALRVAELARGAAERLPERAPAEAHLEARLAELALQRGDLERAERHVQRSLELQVRLHGEGSSAHGLALDARASLLFLRGDFPGALAEYRRVAESFERAYGPHHPLLGNVLNNIGAAELSMFRFADAEATYLRALELLRGAYGDSHPALATVHSNLGFIALGQARLPDAIAAFERSRAIYEAHLPPEHPSRGDCLLDLGSAYMVARRFAEAEEAFRGAQAIYAAAFGAGQVKTTQALAGVGEAQLRGGRLAEARASFERALAEFRGPADDPALGLPLAGLGKLRLLEGHPADAVARLEGALERLRRNSAAAPHEVAAAEFALARALCSGAEARPERCRELARSAREGYVQVGAAFAAEAAEIDAWLAQGFAGGSTM